MSDSVQNPAGRPETGRPVTGALGRAPAVVTLGALSLLAACAVMPGGKADLEARSSAAEHATRSGDWETAADRWYTIFRDGGCLDVHSCAEAARAMIELGDPESASAVVKLGLQHHPDEPQLLQMEAEALVASGFRRSAESSYERALSGNPDNTRCLLGLARQRMALGKESLAVRPLERLVELGTADYEVYSLLARARAASGDSVGAFDAWGLAFRGEDGGVPGAGPLSPSEVADRLEAAMLFMDSDVVEDRPDAAEVCGRWLIRVIEHDPQCTAAHFELGVLYERSDKLDLAESSYRRAVETDPACLMALTNLAVLYSQRKDTESTRRMVDRALDLETHEQRRRALQKLVEDCARAAEPSQE